MKLVDDTTYNYECESGIEPVLLFH